ncbi:hypothetical protein K4039_01875, partial [Lyngbya sp. CCAP 1446/10]|uniref:hypothetical protein n=1 Tax=Lyngbya sp. CCAP 1446/10 TaxID=439293 RepID=UPI0022388079
MSAHSQETGFFTWIKATNAVQLTAFKLYISTIDQKSSPHLYPLAKPKGPSPSPPLPLSISPSPHLPIS